MHSITHAIIGLIATILFRLEGTDALVFILASVLIDIDHITDRKLSFKHILNPIAYAKDVNYKSAQQSMHIFHTVEFMVILFLFGLRHHALMIIWYAFILHIALDALGNIWNRNINNKGTPDWFKYWFVSYYLFKKR